MAGALTGYRIIDLTTNMLGPTAAQSLGDMGADIIKVEPPAGDDVRYISTGKNPGMSAIFMNCNRNKRSICLDLKTSEGKQALKKLVAGADVFLHTMRAKAIQKLGFDYAAVAAIKPDIVYAQANGFGQQGPYADRPAYDDIIQAASGFGMLNKRLYGKPGYVPMPIIDKIIGVMLGSSVTTALLHRERTGEGQFVEVPMFESIVAFNLVEHLYGKVFEPPVAEMGYPRAYNQYRRPFKTKDGYMGLLPNTQKHWQDFFDIIGKPALKDDPRFIDFAQRTIHVEALYEVIDNALPDKTNGEWMQLFEAGDIPFAQLNDLDDLLQEPHLEAVNLFKQIQHQTEGTIRTTDIPVQYSKSPGDIRRLAPNLGEHTEQILAELDYSSTEIQQLLDSKAASKFTATE
ncbi:MAG: CoA transferase [Pseudomonadales bacterium]|nr:CoA transferase [Pseudomonadales bacterium]